MSTTNKPTRPPGPHNSAVCQPRAGGFGRLVGHAILRVMGWRLVGEFPSCPKYVIALAPHTSNWDLALGMGSLWSRGMRISWMMKREAFIWPLGPLWRALGGIPIDRRNAGDVTAQAVRWFDSRRSAVLAITPEGTRRAVPHYRKGYLRIARGAGVPILIAGIDSRNKTILLDRLWHVGEDLDADNMAIRDYVRANFRGVRPSRD